MNRVPSKASCTLRAVILDLCGTLYSSEKLSSAYKAELVQAVAYKYHLPYAEANNLIQETIAQCTRQLGYRPSTLYLSIRFRVKQEYMQGTETVDPSLYISPFEEVQTMIHSLARDHILAILTHSTRLNTSKVLNILGIGDCFKVMVTAESIIHPKPHLQPFQIILNELRLRPQTCCMVGDRVDVDLAPAKYLGMRTILVGEKSQGKPPFVDCVVESVREIPNCLAHLEGLKSRVSPFSGW